jgi:hypothetical protein
MIEKIPAKSAMEEALDSRGDGLSGMVSDARKEKKASNMDYMSEDLQKYL